MSAICGLFDRRGEPAEGLLGASMAALSRYGRHGSFEWYGRGIALGEQSSCALPEPCGARTGDSGSRPTRVVVADLRLDNRQELCDALGVPPGERQNRGDADLLLKAYDRWAERCPERLLGDFAFAIWDEQRRALFCARDIVGARPLYYSTTGGRFAFASDLAALLEITSDRTIDPAYLKRWLQDQLFHHVERTFYKGVLKLLPAHAMLVTSDGPRQWAYWRPEDAPEVRHARESDYFDHLRELMNAAVACRLDSPRGVAAHLSGGLDSSTITVLAARQQRAAGRALTAISWSPPPAEGEETGQDERSLVAAIAAAEGVEVQYTPISADMLVEDWTADATVHPIQTLVFEREAARRASAKGIGVILSGWGGDEFAAFNGRGHTADLFARGRWLTLARELRLRARNVEANRLGLRTRILLPLLPDWFVERYVASKRPFAMPLSRSLRPQIAERLERVSRTPFESGRERRGVHANQLRLLRWGHLQLRMESWFDHGATYGVEYRYPMLDRRLVEFSLGVPGGLYFRNGWKRYLFRSATAGILPDAVRWKRYKADPAVSDGFRGVFDAAVRAATDTVKDASGTVTDRPDFLDRAQLIRDLEATGSEVSYRASAIRALFLDSLHAGTVIAPDPHVP